MNENDIVQTLEANMGEIFSKEKSVRIAVCGGTGELRECLASAVFGEERATSFCTFYETSQDIDTENVDVIWSLGDFVQCEVPCYALDVVDKNEIMKLINWTGDILCGGVKTTFVKYQKLDINLKVVHAHTIIKQHCAGAFGVGFIPIPFSDAPLLVANELYLMSRILDVYNLKDVSTVIKTMGISSVIGGLLKGVGKGLVGNIIKHIPVAGTLVGGIINAATATTIVLGFGESVSLVAKSICMASMENNTEQEKYLCNNFSEAVAGTALQCIEDGRTKPDDYPENEIANFSIQDCVASIKKGNEAFQKFLDENYKLDDEFGENQKKDEQLSHDMWDAISKI